MKAHTEDCVVMLPTGNRTGSVKMLSPLRTGKIITRDQFKVLPMPLSVIERLNGMAVADGINTASTTTEVSTDSVRVFDHTPSHLPTMLTPQMHTGEDPDIALQHPRIGFPQPELADEVGLGPPDDTDGQFEYGEAGDVPRNNHDDVSGHLTDTTDANQQPYDRGAHIGGDSAGDDRARGDIGGDEDYGGGQPQSATETERDPPTDPAAEAQQDRHTRAGRLLDYFRRGGTDVALMSKELMEDLGYGAERALNITVREAIRTRGEEAERVIMKELSQMIIRGVWTPIDGRKLTAEERSRIIRSSTFLKEKYLASGEFEKLKARLVAGGDQQDKDIYDDLSAPTVSTSSVFTILAIAAHEGRKAAVVDIGGVFLNAEMRTGVSVHMRLDRVMSDMLIRLKPSYSKFLDVSHHLVVLLNRAQYGCVESAALWYDNLREKSRPECLTAVAFLATRVTRCTEHDWEKLTTPKSEELCYGPT
jgi:hypothetical protein